MLFRGKNEYSWQPKTLEHFFKKQFDRLDVNKNDNEKAVQPAPSKSFLIVKSQAQTSLQTRLTVNAQKVEERLSKIPRGGSEPPKGK